MMAAAFGAVFADQMGCHSFPTGTVQHRHTEVAGEIWSYSDGTFVDPILITDELLYPENYTLLLPYFTSPCDDPLISSLSPQIFPHEDFDSYPYLKRQKHYENLYHSDFMPNCLKGIVPNSSPVRAVPEFFTMLPEFQIPQVNFAGDVNNNGRKSKDACVSAQSIAERQRRRKITEKTQGLGKLIPGGNKMNTAEMLQAAFKYVKYLQAQVGILKFIGSIQESKGTTQMEELQVLIASSTVQENLYLEDKCLVPKDFDKPSLFQIKIFNL